MTWPPVLHVQWRDQNLNTSTFEHRFKKKKKIQTNRFKDLVFLFFFLIRNPLKRSFTSTGFLLDWKSPVLGGLECVSSLHSFHPRSLSTFLPVWSFATVGSHSILGSRSCVFLRISEYYDLLSFFLSLLLTYIYRRSGYRRPVDMCIIERERFVCFDSRVYQ